VLHVIAYVTVVSAIKYSVKKLIKKTINPAQTISKLQTQLSGGIQGFLTSQT